MADINRVLYTAKQAILSNLTAINVTGANIANVNTPGYSRLRPMFEAVGTKDATSSLEQIGVKISDVQRIYDKFLDSQIVLQDSAVGSATSRKSLLTQIEGVLNESAGGGINDALSIFWSAWDSLSTNPSGKAERDVLVSTAQNLTSIFNQRAEQLSNIQYSIDQTISDTVAKLNSDLAEMAVINAEIVKTESAGGQATSLRDNRLALLREISTIIDINYIERSDASLYIYMASNGKALVEEDNSWDLTVQTNSANSNLYDIVFSDDLNNPLNDYIQGGELGGLLDVRDVVLKSYINELNQTASSIINKVNFQHMAGYDQNGNIGGLFFTQTDEAKYMQVSAAIVDNTRKIAASATVNADGDNANAIASIRDDKMYASLGQVLTTVGTGSAAGQINNIGQTYKNTTSAITLMRGATAAPADWTVVNNGGYSSLTVFSADERSLAIDLDGNNTADITLVLSGSWANGDTLAFSLTKQDSTTSIDGYYNAFMARMGQDAANSALVLDREQTIANQHDNQREQLSGVSLDEEMLDLIKYQMAYNAAGRITKTVSDMMDILINMGQ